MKRRLLSITIALMLAITAHGQTRDEVYIASRDAMRNAGYEPFAIEIRDCNKDNCMFDTRWVAKIRARRPNDPKWQGVKHGTFRVPREGGLAKATFKLDD